jgi:hypothetical protein
VSGSVRSARDGCWPSVTTGESAARATAGTDGHRGGDGGDAERGVQHRGDTDGEHEYEDHQAGTRPRAAVGRVATSRPSYAGGMHHDWISGPLPDKYNLKYISVVGDTEIEFSRRPDASATLDTRPSARTTVMASTTGPGFSYLARCPYRVISPFQGRRRVRTVSLDSPCEAQLPGIGIPYCVGPWLHQSRRDWPSIITALSRHAS